MPKESKKYNDQERIEIVQKIDRFRAEGLTFSEAFKRAEVSIEPQTYFTWKNRITKNGKPSTALTPSEIPSKIPSKIKKPQLVTITEPAPKEEKVVILMGMPSEIKDILSKIGVSNG